MAPSARSRQHSGKKSSVYAHALTGADSVAAMLKIATWNLENFFRPGGGSGPTTDQAYRDKLEHLTQTITAIDPDVLAVQEVGQPEALEDLRAQLGGGWHAIASSHPDGRGIRVGFLS